MTPEIKIDMDKPCTKCGQMGSGICLECATQKYSRIGEKVIANIADHVENLLRTYLPNLNRAYLNEDSMKVGFSVDIEPGTGGDLVITTKISFVESKVKDELQVTVNERQMALGLK